MPRPTRCWYPYLTAALGADDETAALGSAGLSGRTGVVVGALAEDPATAEALRLAAGALDLAAHVLADSPRELPGQLLGRLPAGENPRLDSLRAGGAGETRWPAMLPISPTFTAPGGSLLPTLAWHTDRITQLALTPDGRTAVAGDAAGRVHILRLRGLALPA